MSASRHALTRLQAIDMIPEVASAQLAFYRSARTVSVCKHGECVVVRSKTSDV